MQSSEQHNNIVSQKEPESSMYTFFRELFQFTLIALLVILPIRYFIAQPFIVSGSSMEETFAHGDYLIVDQLSYRFNTPARGDVVIFRYPRDPSKFFIKRVIGLPGERVLVAGNNVTIFNDTHPEGLLLSEPYVVLPGSDPRLSTTLLEDEYFVLGDNRTNSSDSRVWGPLPKNNIVGTAFTRLLPFTNISYRPGLFNAYTQ